MQDIHLEVGAVVHPHGATDPQRVEALILTRSLLSALLRATSAGTHAAVTSSMILDLYLAETLPAFGGLLQAHRRRQEHPGLSAQEDFVDLLARAGQKNMGIAVFTNRPPEVVGQPQIHVEFGGQNAELFRQWSEGGHGASLVLQSKDGELNISYGHPELDRLLLPEGREATVFEFSEVKTQFPARVRVSAPHEPDVFVDAAIAYAPRSKEMDVKFGAEKCSIWFTMTPTGFGGLRINVRLNVNSGPQVLPVEYRSVLRAMRLIGRDEMQVVLSAGAEIVRPDGTSVRLEKDELLFNGGVWTSDERSDGPRVETALSMLSEVHLMYQQIATFLDEEHGVDTAQLTVLEDLDKNAIDVLRRIVSVIKSTESPLPVNVDFHVSQEVGQLLKERKHFGRQGVSDIIMQMEATGVMDVGARVLEVVGKIQDLDILETEPVDGLIAIHAAGILQNQTLKVHPAGTFSDMFSNRKAAE